MLRTRSQSGVAQSISAVTWVSAELALGLPAVRAVPLELLADFKTEIRSCSRRPGVRGGVFWTWRLTVADLSERCRGERIGVKRRLGRPGRRATLRSDQEPV
jgi:hypothetical protein